MSQLITHSTPGRVVICADRQRKLRHGDKFRVSDTTLQFILQDTGRGRTYEIA